MVGKGRRRARTKNRQSDWRDRDGDSFSGYRRRFERVLSTFGRQRSRRRIRDRQVRESASGIPTKSRSQGHPLCRLTHQNALVSRRSH